MLILHPPFAFTKIQIGNKYVLFQGLIYQYNVRLKFIYSILRKELWHEITIEQTVQFEEFLKVFH